MEFVINHRFLEQILQNEIEPIEGELPALKPCRRFVYRCEQDSPRMRIAILHQEHFKKFVLHRNKPVPTTLLRIL